MSPQEGRPQRAVTWSYGGGTQSIAIAILVAQGRLPKPECIVIADTGREASETWEYHEKHTAPLLASVGLRVEVASHDLATVDLYATDGKTILPMYTAEGALRAFCSSEWKKAVLRRFLRSKGYGPKRPVATWIGISLDETERLKSSDVQWQKNHYPLCFDVPMRRSECIQLVKDYGFPEPPKSSCWMCPYRRNAQWRRLRDHYPEDWRKAVALDAEVRERDPQHALYLHDGRVALADADLGKDEETAALPLFEAGCQAGYCWT